MPFLHFSLVPSIVIILSIFMQSWISKDEFIDFFKIYAFGVLTGILVSIIFFFINKIFINSANYIILLLKSLFIDGLLFSIIISVCFYFILKLFVSSMSFSWFFASLLSFSFLCGIFSAINIIECFSHDYPNNPLNYLPYISLLLFISMFSGFGFPKFSDAFDLFKKILWAGLCILVLSVCFGFYKYLGYYNNLYQYLFILPLIVIAVIFDRFEFKYIRGR